MNEKQKCCIIIFDEMSLSCQIQYNKKEDYVEGVGKNGSSPEIVDHTNVFMVQGIYSRWKQPVCFTFSDGPIKTMFLKKMIKTVITKCQEIGLNVIATTLLLYVIKDTDEIFKRKGKENKLFGFLVNDQEIVALYDVPHLFKGLRNNLLEKNLHFTLKGQSRIAKWDHIKCLYYLDSEEDERICPKLTDRHILKERINKMKVSTCMQVFSYQVGSLMKGIAIWDKLFDSLNANSKTGPTTKPLKGGVT
ncbi:hypothetical protein NQ315_010011 [Exocentrus adspersus]|uniref:Transposase n=1 Tax=Exocentrus adspersus TaxID=1586481 RepID=A0AAV8VK71_9CUCU|nr:hypothetical protein NQ315_010011 [Exocentrus adspersus]